MMNGRKIVITGCFDRRIAAEITNDRLTGAYIADEESKLGAIYIGKVKNVVKNIGACFVEIEDGETAFLPLKEASYAFLLNRASDGRILQEDEVLVQVQRDAIKTKQAGLTARLNISSEYFAFSFGERKLGISSKLCQETRYRLEKLLFQRGIIDESKCLIPKEGMPPYGMVLRTASEELLMKYGEEKFMECLSRQHTEFAELITQSRFHTCFHCIYASSVYSRIPAYFSENNYEEIVTDMTDAFEALKDRGNVRLYQDAMLPLKKLYSLESRLQEALRPYVWLKSGASLVIEQTEAFNIIDVNSSKFDKKTVSEDTLLQINIEAAREIALQIRLRNLSGIIIVDFISMKSKEAEQRLLQELRRYVAQDSIPTRVIDITQLGLVELTRQRRQKSLQEQWQHIKAPTTEGK